MALDPFGPSAGLDPSQPVAGLDPFAPDPNAPGPLKRGFGAGVSGVKANLAGAGALIAHAAGAKELEQAALDKAHAESEIAAQQSQKLEDVDWTSPSSVADQFKWLLGNAIPSLATIFAGGAIGRGLGALATRRAAAATQAAGTRAGMFGGAVAPDVALEAGGIYPEALKNEVEDPALRAAVGGVAAGSLDFLPLLAAEKYLKAAGKGGFGAMLKGAAKGAPVGAVLEGAQEAGQSAIERAAAGSPLTGDEAVSDYINSFAGGAVPGTVFGAAIGGARGRAGPVQETPPSTTGVPAQIVDEPPAPLPTPFTGARLDQQALDTALLASLGETPPPPPGGGTPGGSAPIPVEQPYRRGSAPVAEDADFNTLEGLRGKHAEVVAKRAALDAELAKPEKERRKKGMILKEAKALDTQIEGERADIDNLTQKIRNRFAFEATGEIIDASTRTAPAEPAYAESGAFKRPEVDNTEAAEVTVAKQKRDVGALLSSREAKLLRESDKAAPPAPKVAAVQENQPRERFKQETPERRAEVIEGVATAAVEKHKQGLVFREGTADAATNALNRAVVEASRAPTIEAAEKRIFDAAIQALAGKVNKGDAETFAAAVAKDVRSAPTFYSKAGLKVIDPRIDSSSVVEALMASFGGTDRTKWTPLAKKNAADYADIKARATSSPEMKAKYEHAAMVLRGEAQQTGTGGTRFSKGGVGKDTEGPAPTTNSGWIREFNKRNPLDRSFSEDDKIKIAKEDRKHRAVQRGFDAEARYYAWAKHPAIADLVDTGVDFENADPAAVRGTEEFWDSVLRAGKDAVQFRAEERGIKLPLDVLKSRAGIEVTKISDLLAYVPHIALTHSVTGGSSTNLVDGKDMGGSDNYTVSIYKDRELTIEGQPTERQIADYIEANADILATPGHVMGTWFNKRDGLTYLDVSVLVPTVEEAIALGREHNQIAVFYLGSYDEIPVGSADVFSISQEYASNAGLTPAVAIDYLPVDPQRMQQIAMMYTTLMPDNSGDSKVYAAYEAFVRETEAQFALASSRIQIEPWRQDGQPYQNSQEMMRDVKNKHLWVYEGGDPHPLMTPEQNWKFRAVHDIFGHAKTGFEFGPRGELNATRSHAQMYTEAAWPALMTETLGQNAWVNFSVANRDLPPSQRMYAEQKADLLPESLWRDLMAAPLKARDDSIDQHDLIFTDKGQRLLNHLRGMVGNDPNLEVRLFTAEKGQSVGGFTRTDKLKALISLALNANNDLSVAEHEGFHYLEDRVLSGSERVVISRQLREGSPTYNKLIERARAYDAQNKTNITDEILSIPQEARAYGYEFWRRGELQVDGTLDKIFAKIREFLERVRNYVDGLGFTSMNDIFTAIERGAYAQAGAEFKTTDSTSDWVADVEPDVIPGMRTLHKEGGAASTAKGRPYWIKSGADVAKMRARLKKLALEGETGRQWHANSAQAILTWARGDQALAAKMAALIANFSPRTPVGLDLKKAFTAFVQFEAKQPLEPGAPMEHTLGARRILTGFEKDGTPAPVDEAGNVRPTGIKRENFFKNLMLGIDPKHYNVSTQGATIDMWMAHAFGYANDVMGSVTKSQYNYSDAEVKRLAKELGWSVEETQAAVWVAIKARGNSTRSLMERHALNRGWYEQVAKKSASTGPVSWDLDIDNKAIKSNIVIGYLDIDTLLPGSDHRQGPLREKADSIADEMKRGKSFEPAFVKWEGNGWKIRDGRHRIIAARSAGVQGAIPVYMDEKDFSRKSVSKTPANADLLGDVANDSKRVVKADKQRAFVTEWMRMSLINPISKEQLAKANYDYAQAFEDIYAGKIDLSQRLDELPYQITKPAEQEGYDIPQQATLFSKAGVNIGKFSSALEAEIQERIETFNEQDEVSRDGQILTRGDVLYEMMQDMDDKDSPAYHFRNELRAYGIAQGFWKGYSKEELDRRVAVSHGKKYDFKVGERYYVFDSWEAQGNTFYSRAGTADMDRQMAHGELERPQEYLAAARLIDRAYETGPDNVFKLAFGSLKSELGGNLTRWLKTNILTPNFTSRFSNGFKNVFTVLNTYDRYRSILIKTMLKEKMPAWYDASTEDQNAAFKGLLDRTVRGLKRDSVELTELMSTLTPQQKTLFISATKMIEGFLVSELEADKVTYRALLTTEGEYDKWVAQRTAQVAEMLDKGYVPLRRYGDHTVVVIKSITGPDGRQQDLVVARQGFDRAASAEAAGQIYKEEISRSGADLRVEVGYQYKAARDTTISVQQFIDTARRNGVPLTQVERERIVKALSNADSMSRNRLLRREGTAGYSEDGMRVLSEFGVGMAGKMAYAKFAPAIDAASDGLKVGVDIIRNEPEIVVHDAPHPETGKPVSLWDQEGPQAGYHRNLADELTDYVLVPDHTGTWSRKLRSAAMMYFLGGSISGAMVNTMSVPMLVVPELSLHTNYYNAMSTTLAAWKTAWGNQSVLRDIVKLKDKDANPIPDIDRVPGLRQALIQASEDGRTMDTEIHQIMGMAQGTMYSQSRTVQRAIETWMAPFRVSEQTNRITSFIAGYKVGRENNLTGRELYNFAGSIVDSTQNNYNEANRPGAARNPIFALMFMFKSFPLFMVEAVALMYKANPKSAVYMLLGLTMLTGVQGLPFAETIEDLIDTIAQKIFGSPFNSRRAMRNVLKQASEAIVGYDMSGLVMRGVINDVLGMSVSSRIGAGDFVPGSRLGTADADQGRVLEQMLGAPYAMLKDTLENALGLIASAATLDWKKSVDALRAGGPVAVRNAIKGVEQLQNGYASDSQGRKLIDVTTPAALWQTIGISSAGLAKAYEFDRIDKQTNAFYTQVRGDMQSQMARAIKEGDSARAQDIYDAANAWNASYPDMPLRLDPSAIRRQLVLSGINLNERTLKMLPRQLRGTSLSIEGSGATP